MGSGFFVHGLRAEYLRENEEVSTNGRESLQMELSLLRSGRDESALDPRTLSADCADSKRDKSRLSLCLESASSAKSADQYPLDCAVSARPLVERRS